MARGALVDDECLNRMIIQGAELQCCLSAVGLSYTKNVPKSRTSSSSSSTGSSATEEDKPLPVALLFMPEGPRLPIPWDVACILPPFFIDSI